MRELMIAWELASYYKIGNDIVQIANRNKNPFQVLLETYVNESAKNLVYNSLFTKNR